MFAVADNIEGKQKHLRNLKDSSRSWCLWDSLHEMKRTCHSPNKMRGGGGEEFELIEFVFRDMLWLFQTCWVAGNFQTSKTWVFYFNFQFSGHISGCKKTNATSASGDPIPWMSCIRSTASNAWYTKKLATDTCIAWSLPIWFRTKETKLWIDLLKHPKA